MKKKETKRERIELNKKWKDTTGNSRTKPETARQHKRRTVQNESININHKSRKSETKLERPRQNKKNMSKRQRARQHQKERETQKERTGRSEKELDKTRKNEK